MELLTVEDVKKRYGVGRPTAEKIMDAIVKHKRGKKRLVSDIQIEKYFSQVKGQ